MEKEFLEQLSKNLPIAKDRLIVEYYEMIVLNKLMLSPLVKFLVFKGGTALRLAYGSSRFSEDLDFSLLDKIPFSLFVKEISSLEKEVSNIKISELREKYYTFFALIKVKENLLKQTFSMKVEVSKRPVNWQEQRDYEFKQFISPTNPLSPSGLVVTLTRAYKDKRKAIRDRIKGRDFFDLWWLSQALKKKFSPPKRKFDKRAIINELHIFLPKNYWQFLDSILSYYES